jgi:type I restriction enzyme, S subunit
MRVKAKQVELENVETLDTDLPEGWAITRLGELSTYITSGSRDWSRFYADHGALFVRTQDINKNILASIDEIARVALPAKVEGKRTLIRQGDLLITITGANVGKCALVDGLLPEAYVSQSVALVRTANGCNGHFIQRQLIAPSPGDGHTLLQRNAYGVGRPVLNLDNIRDLPIVLAPNDEQQRIVAKIQELLRGVNSARTRLARSLTILKQFRQSLLAAACSGKLTEDWRRHYFKELPPVPRATGPDGYELPDQWAWTHAGELYIDARYGTSVKCGGEIRGGVPVLRVPNIARGELDLRHLKYARFSERELDTLAAKPGDILVCRTNGSLELIGKAAVIPALDTVHSYASYLIRLRLDTAMVLPRYFHIFISGRVGRDQIEERARTTAGQFNLNLEILRELNCPLPLLEEQQEIVRRVEALSKLADLIERRVATASLRAERLTDAILAKAFRGELVPTEAELARREGREYEPASAVLERIRAEREKAEQTRPKREKKTRVTRKSNSAG